MFAWEEEQAHLGKMLHMGIMRDPQRKEGNLYSEKFLHECQFSEFLYKHVQYLRTDSER